jgi:N-acetylneuraminic acid mutarotase
VGYKFERKSVKTLRGLLLATLLALSVGCSIDFSVEDQSADLISQTNSKIVPDGTTPKANGSDSMTVEVHFLDSGDNGIVGITPEIEIHRFGDDTSEASEVEISCTETGSDGISTCTLTSTKFGQKKLTVTSPPILESEIVEFNTDPTITGISPAFIAASGGGATITISGTDFDPDGADVEIVGSGSCLGLTVVDENTITCTVPDEATAGDYQIKITNDDGEVVTLSGAVVYTLPATISTIGPDGGTISGGQTITITGTNFYPNGTTTITVDGEECTNVTVVNSTTITCVTPSGGSYGSGDVVVTNPDGRTVTASNAYTYQVPPTVSSLSIDGGPLAGGQALTITGSDFIVGKDVTVEIGGVDCTGATVDSSTQISCTTGGNIVGTYDVVVTAYDGQSDTLANSYEYRVAPTVSSISLNAGDLGGGRTVTITGSDFLAGATVAIGGVNCGSVSVGSSTQITCTTGAHAAGTVDVVVTNYDAQTGTLSNGYTYQPAPTVTSVSLAGGPLAGGVSATIYGTGFVAGATVTFDGLTCTSPNVVNSTSMTCTTPAHASGSVDVVVTNADLQTGTLSNGYDYNPAPTVTSVNLPGGPLAGGQTVTVTGTGFFVGATVDFGGTSCGSVNVDSATQITCTTGAHSAGTVDVTVTNYDAQSGTGTDLYDYQPAPTISNVVPSQGRTGGGELVVIQGTGFVATPSVTIGGSSCTSVNRVNSNQLTCITPSGSGASNVVVTNYDSQFDTEASGYEFTNSIGVWSAGNVNTSAPTARREAASAWTGSHLVVWGGYNGAAMETGGVYDAVADSWSAITSTNDPAARYAATGVWTGNAFIVWGGYNGSYLNSGGSYDPVSDSWSTVTTTGAAATRAYHSAVWTGSRMIVWGGYNGSYLDSGGVYNPGDDSWTTLTTSGSPPTARQKHVAVWTGDRMIVWGGDAGAASFSTGSMWDREDDTWVAVDTASAPSARSQFSAVWTGAQMIVWGGCGTCYDNTIYGYAHNASAIGVTNTGGAFDPYADADGAWSSVSTTSAPAARYQHTAVWTGSRMIIWGGSEGYSASTPQYANTGGIYDPANDRWTATQTTSAPSERSFHVAAWTGYRMIVWGGYYDGPTYYDNGSLLSLNDRPNADSWIATTNSSAPSAREGHSAIWTGYEMIVWGGEASGTAVNTGSMYDPVSDSWAAVTTTSAPSARYDHTSVWTGSEMLVWGGTDGSTYYDTGGLYDPVTDTWSPTSTTSVPAGRANHTAVWTGSAMAIFGGTDGSGELSDAATLQGSTWTSLASSGLSARKGHTAVFDGTRMIVFGGEASGVAAGTGAAYNFVTSSWSSINTGAPSARYNHTAVWTGKEMIIYGGDSGAGDLSDGSGYDPIGDSWSSITSSGSPVARSRHTAVWTGDSMVVWGGLNGSSAIDSGGRYHPGDDSWTSTSSTYVAEARFNHTAVWMGQSGSEGSAKMATNNSGGPIGMIVWGGNDGSDEVSTGGVYYP